MGVSSLEQLFDSLWNLHYPEIDLETEVKLISGRRFRFDYVHLKSKTAIEVNGGNYINGRHTRGVALNSEYEKFNLAQIQGYQIFLLSGDMVTKNWLDAIAEHILKNSFRY